MNESLARLLGCGTRVVYDRLEDLPNQLLLKQSLHEYGVTRQDLRNFIRNVITGQIRLMDNGSVPLDETRVFEIYTELSWITDADGQLCHIRSGCPHT